MVVEEQASALHETSVSPVTFGLIDPADGLQEVLVHARHDAVRQHHLRSADDGAHEGRDRGRQEVHRRVEYATGDSLQQGRVLGHSRQVHLCRLHRDKIDMVVDRYGQYGSIIYITNATIHKDDCNACMYAWVVE